MFSFKYLFYVLFSILAVFGTDSQMAPAAASHSRLFELGSSRDYQYTSTVLLNEHDEQGKAVGYQVAGQVIASVVWEGEAAKLLQFELKSPKVFIMSRKVPEPESYVQHKSQLESFPNYPFLALWNQGVISKVYLDKREDSSLKNIKKGIASLFQFQVVETKKEETDVSGTCQVTYRSVDPVTILKSKSECRGRSDVPYVNQPDPLLSTNVVSKRSAAITLNTDLSLVDSIRAEETHAMTVVVRPEAGTAVTTIIQLTSTGKSVKPTQIKADDLKSAVKSFEKSSKVSSVEENLTPDVSVQSCSKAECPTLPALVKELRGTLHDSLLGTVKSANSFIRLLDAGRSASQDELYKAFKGSKNKEVILQLCDLAGAIHTLEAHQVIKKIIDFEKEEDLDKTERYLWAVSVNSHPKLEIIQDIYKISQRPSLGEKVSETLLLTLASMVRKFSAVPGNNKEQTIVENVANTILTELKQCTSEECKYKALRALRNLQCPKTIPILIQHAVTGKARTSVEAMKTLRAFHPRFWDEKVVDTAQKIYYQAGRKFDSSARTLAIDILLESSPKREVLTEMVASLLEKDPSFEVKQYLNQRLQQISEQDQKFSEVVHAAKRDLAKQFANYDAGAIRGLTTAFTRSFSKTSQWNGSLVNVQEVSGGLLKRGIVDVVLSTENESTSVFTLGLFAGGLGSFVSSDKPQEDSNEVPAEEEVATAGMELSVMGTRIRPFVFFAGQGELMGHVWSGTASEKTPAFQAFVMTHDHLEHIGLQTGLVAQLQLHGAVSFDLSGQIQISLWNRNAHSLVEENAGISLQGRTQVDTSFIKSQVGFSVGTEVKLNLQSDLNFYGGVSLCMQLVQPDAVLRHNVHKVERIIGSKHRLRKSKYKSIILPGKTYVLNQKNNEMCNAIFTK